MTLGTQSPPLEHRSIFDISIAMRDPVARRMRDRYIAQRFPQFNEPHRALKNTESVLNWARQFVDDDRPQLAVEILNLALQEDPAQRPIWLFLIEYAFLETDSARFNELADAFKRQFPGDTAIELVNTMGHDFAPTDPRYSHINAPAELPDWSKLESGDRNRERQQKFHVSLTEAMAFHLPR